MDLPVVNVNGQVIIILTELYPSGNGHHQHETLFQSVEQQRVGEEDGKLKIYKPSHNN